MIKKLAIFAFSFLLCVGNFVNVFADSDGWDGMEYCNMLLYLNGTPIRAYTRGGYDEINGKRIYNNYIFIDDLERYGFEMIKDEKTKTLQINRIPGKEPDPLTEEEYQALITRKKSRESIGTSLNPSIYRGYKEYLNGIPLDSPNYYFTENGTFIRTTYLAKCFGDTKEVDVEAYTEKINLIYDYRVCRTELTDYVYYETEPLKESILEKRKEFNPNDWFVYYKIYDEDHKGFRERYEHSLVAGFLPYSDIDYSFYWRVDKSFDKGNIQYRFTEDSLIIEKNQKHPKNILEYYNNSDVPHTASEFRETTQSMKSTSLVNIKLYAGEEPYRTDELFPPLISMDGELYIRIDALMDILKMTE